MHPFEAYRRRQNPPLTQAALGRLLGVTRAYISMLEQNKRRLSVDMAISASVRMGISLAQLRPDIARHLRKQATE
jgi:transcriptional regulator with XRE-family HTH domain